MVPPGSPDQSFCPRTRTHGLLRKLDALDKNDPEIKQRSLLVALTLLKDSKTINSTRFSTWTSLKRVTAWVLRFISNSKKVQKARRGRTRRKKAAAKVVGLDRGLSPATS